MKALNFYGLSYQFEPNTNIDFVNVSSQTYTDEVIDGNKIYFFDGLLPTTEDLYNITTEAELMATFGDRKIMGVEELTFSYTYDVATKERNIKKIPVDALDVPIEKTGTIGWAAIIMNDIDTPTADTKAIIFTDTIGVWGDQTSPIIIDRYDSVAGETNIFKDFSIILRDISTNEGA